jgi:hypothetical protein
MFGKLPLVRLSTAIAISALTVGAVPVRANSSSRQVQPVSSFRHQLIAGDNSKIRRYGKGQVVTDADSATVSGASEIALAEHLAKSGVKFYGAVWCSHCAKQKSMFGAVAASKLLYVECGKDAPNSQRQLCINKQIRMFPSWSIGGKLVEGTRELKDIAQMTGYQGPMDFKYHK